MKIREIVSATRKDLTLGSPVKRLGILCWRREGAGKHRARDWPMLYLGVCVRMGKGYTKIGMSSIIQTV